MGLFVLSLTFERTSRADRTGRMVELSSRFEMSSKADRTGRMVCPQDLN
uniref:Uncharacterized protein n=1 Tax=Manihot esculenta TaxID=3983 RepID=A0A2C9UWB0_MANES